MKYFKQDLLTLLISLFVLTSCNKNDQLGLDVSSEDQIELKLIDTASIRTNTVLEDTLITSGLSQHPLGLLRDPIIGDTESRLAMTLNLPRSPFDFGTSPSLDSAVLVLKYGDDFYGDSVNSRYTVEVRQLSEKYNSLNTYSNLKAWSANAAVIGSKTFSKFAIRDSVTVRQLVDGKPDIDKKTAPHLRIPISNAFINSNFLNQSTNLANTTAFQNFIKGLYLTIKTQAGDRGGIVFFNLAQADSSRLEIYYKNPGTAIDTNIAKFNISNTGAAANITHTYTAAVQSQLANPSQQFSTVYVQPLAGLRAKVIFPYLNKLRELANITVNKAELVVSIEGGTDAALSPAPRLTLYRTDIAGQRREFPDRDLGQVNGTYGDARFLAPGAFGGLYNSTKKQYTFVVTSYIQDLLSGKSTQYAAYLAPLKNIVTSSQGDPTDIMPSATTAARSVLGGGNGTTYKMKLNIIYTKLK